MSVRKIAEVTNLSVATVSRVLNGKGKVSEATRQRVLEAVETLDYVYNPYVGNVMSALRRQEAANFRGNIALIRNSNYPGAKEEGMFKEARRRSQELGFSLSEFDFADYSTKTLERILYTRGIQGVLLHTPSLVGQIHLKMNLENLACVSIGSGLWKPSIDVVQGNRMEMYRLALHHAARRFGGGIIGILNEREDDAAHKTGRAGFVIYHPLGPTEASRLIMNEENLSEAVVKRIVKKYKIKCVIFGIGVVPPAWLSRHIPSENWIWFRQPGKRKHFGQVTSDGNLIIRWGINLLSAKILMRDIGVPKKGQIVLVPPQWIPGTAK